MAQKIARNGQDVEEGFVEAIDELEGTFALAVISIDAPGRIFCVKRESPLIIGLGDDANYVGSDFSAFFEFTRRAIIMEDGEYALITPESYAVKSLLTRERVDKEVTEIEWDAEKARRGGYPHFMLKEIYDQPTTVQAALQIPRGDVQSLAGMIHESQPVLPGRRGNDLLHRVDGAVFLQPPGREVSARRQHGRVRPHRGNRPRGRLLRHQPVGGDL